jgi:hypothetical protein
LNGQVHKVKYYYNKRFFKLTEKDLELEPEIENQFLPTEEDLKDTKFLFVSEGNLLPSKTELNFAKKCKFDLYTITNFSFMDLAHFLNLKPNLFAVTKHDLANEEEQV